MNDQPANGSIPAGAPSALGLPVVRARAAFQAGLDRLRSGRRPHQGRRRDRRGPAAPAHTEIDASLDRVPMGRGEGGQPVN